MQERGSGIYFDSVSGDSNGGLVFDRSRPKYGQVGMWSCENNLDRSPGQPEAIWKASYYGEHVGHEHRKVVRVSVAADCSNQEGTQKLKTLLDEELGFKARPALKRSAAPPCGSSLC